MKKSILVVALLVTTFSFSQKLKVTEGDIKNLKGIEQFDVIFDYTDVQIPKYDSEEEFLKDKMTKREEKEKGSGERFKKDWFDDRPEHYHPKFITSFNKRFDDGEVRVTENEAAKYVMKIHTTWLYSGYNVGIVRHSAEINVEITVYSSENPDTILFKGNYKKVQGGGAFGGDYDTGYRISEAYAKTAKEFAKYIKKKAK